MNHALSALRYTEELIRRFGPRLAGSDASRAAAAALADELRRSGCSVREEPFDVHPNAFLGYYRYVVAAYLLSLVFFFLQLPVAALGCFLFIFASNLLEFGFYRETFDPLFSRRKGMNVIARLEPQGVPERQIILSGHHDSAYELRFLRRNQRFYVVRILAPELIYLLGAAFTVWWIASGADPAASALLALGRWLFVAGLLLVLPKYFVLAPHGVPGAGDNLIASAMLPEFARMFADPDRPGTSTLRGTRLVLASFDAEEAGLRGAKRFVRAHRDELTAIPTRMLNFDSLFALRDLQVMTRDINGTVRLDPDLARQVGAIAERLGYPVRPYAIFPGAGGTDAAEFARIGVPATSLIALPTSLAPSGLVYHTMQDTTDRIEPEAVEACLAIGRELVRSIDRGNT